MHRSRRCGRCSSRGDIIIDGGNSHYQDDIARAKSLAADGIHYVDVGTSGGVWGLDRGYCLMIGGDDAAFKQLEPIFKTLSPGPGAIPHTHGTPGQERTPPSTAILHCGPAGAGHFVKMIHNGIEYGLMAAYAEGFNILSHANAGKVASEADAETAPLRNPEHYQYDFDLAEHHRALAARQRDHVVAARSHRRRARLGSGTRKVRRQGVGLGRRPLDGAGCQ